MELTICLFGFLAVAVALCAAISRTRRNEGREIDRMLRALRAEPSPSHRADVDSARKPDESRGDLAINPGGHRLSHDVPTLPLRNRWDLPVSHHEQPATEQFPLPGSDSPLFAESR